MTTDGWRDHMVAKELRCRCGINILPPPMSRRENLFCHAISCTLVSEIRDGLSYQMTLIAS